MDGKISVVINTLNEEKNIERAVTSVKWADEILVCDMRSDDNTAIVAKKLGAKVIFHKKVGFVEPARNFAISHATNQWILVLDADEEIPESLGKRLVEMVKKPVVSSFIEIPRKNIIFNKWMKTSMWWPDYNVRFFRKGAVSWSNKIHRPPQTSGQGLRLPTEERWAIVHHNYQSVGQFIERMNRYTDIESKELGNREILFSDLVTKPLSEFMSRFFANRGFEDGLHGFSLSMLQAFSLFVLYLKLWERQKFKEQDIDLRELEKVKKTSGQQIDFWFKQSLLSKNPIKRALQKARNRL